MNTISLCMTMCTKALLGDPCPELAPFSKPIQSAVESVKATIRSHSEFWSCLKFGARLPDNMNDVKLQMAIKVEEFVLTTEGSGLGDYIPSPFGAYADTFGVITLSDIR